MTKKNLIEWVVSRRKFVTGEVGHIGKWKNIFVAFYHGSPTEEPFVLTCRLPGIKDRIGPFKDLESCKAFAEKAWRTWMEGAGVRPDSSRKSHDKHGPEEKGK